MAATCLLGLEHVTVAMLGIYTGVPGPSTSSTHRRISTLLSPLTWSLGLSNVTQSLVALLDSAWRPGSAMTPSQKTT